MNDAERADGDAAYRILHAAQSAALEELVARGVACGRWVERGGSQPPSFFDAANAYYIARSAMHAADRERMR